MIHWSASVSTLTRSFPYTAGSPHSMKCAGRLKHMEEISSGPGELTKGDGMRHKSICAISVVSLAVLLGNAALGQQRAQGQRGRGAGGVEGAAAPDAPANKTAFRPNDDNKNRLKHNEAKKTINTLQINVTNNISNN